MDALIYTSLQVCVIKNKNKKMKFTSMCKLVCNKSGAIVFTLTWLSNIHVEKRKRERRRCHVKHFTSRNGKQIVDRSMNPWPHTHTTCQDGIQLGYSPLEKCLELDFLELEKSTTYA